MLGRCNVFRQKELIFWILEHILLWVLQLAGLLWQIQSFQLMQSRLSAVFAGVVIGSLIPDVDTVLKLRNNAVYIRHHRGITHSIPAVLLWPLILQYCYRLLFPDANFIHLWAWTFLAVFLHVFVDIFNSYGTQALRPFSNKWVAIGVINTFDPIIFVLHVLAIIYMEFRCKSVFTMLTTYVDNFLLLFIAICD